MKRRLLLTALAVAAVFAVAIVSTAQASLLGTPACCEACQACAPACCAAPKCCEAPACCEACARKAVARACWPA